MPAVDLLKQLIAFPSVSSSSNEAISAFVEQELTRLKFDVERLNYIDDQGVLKVCVCGRRGPRGCGLAWFGHTDVVPVDSWSFPDSGPWDAAELNDRIYGRGSCDMKGSLACMLEAVERAGDTTHPVFIVCTADEEIGYHGAAKVAADSDIFREIVTSNSRGIIGEPTCLQVVHGHKGGHVGRVTSRGAAGHSSTGEGLNANMAMIPFLNDLRTLSLACEQEAKWTDDRFNPPGISMNIGINDHTAAVNITPPESVCTFHFRPMPGQDAEDLMHRIHELATQHGLQFETLMSAGPVYTNPDSPFIRDLEKLTSSRTGTVPYGTDGSFFGEMERLAVLGPGDIRQAHTDDEWIALDQLTAGTALYERLIHHWCVNPAE